MRIDAVGFDLDDTLYAYHQYARAGLEAAGDYLEAETGERYHEELKAIYFDDGITDGTFDVLVKRHDLNPDLVDELVDAFHSASSSLTPYQATESVLTRLEERYYLGLVTDGRGGHGKLNRLAIGEYFDTVLVTPQLNCSKHDPEPFEKLLDNLGVRPDETVYVGDDPRVDFRIPNRKSMTTVRLQRGRYRDLEADDPVARADHQIRDLSALVTLIE